MDSRTTARTLASHGIPVFPLHTVVDGVCSCRKGNQCGRDAGKHPRWHKYDLPNGVTNATADLKQVNTWWKRWPEANIGVATGSESGLVVVDLDGPDGLDSAELLLTQEQIDSALQVATGSGGWHLYFRHPGKDFSIPNGVKILPGVDIRGEGGYVVAPPSLHRSGNVYSWYNSVTFAELPPLPTRLLDAIAAKAPTGEIVKKKLSAKEWGDTLSEGNRNQEMARRIGKLLAADVPADVVLSTMLEFNATYCSPPLEPEEVEKIVSSLQRRDKDRRERQAAAQSPTTTGAGAGTESKKSEKFSLLTLREAFVKYGGYETEWLIDGWMPKSTNGLIVAPPGSYKTWILADLCTAVSGARKFLGQHTVNNPGPVFIVQQEDFLPILMSRIATILLEHAHPTIQGDEFSVPVYQTDWPIYIHDERKLHFGKPQAVQALAEAVEELRPSLVVLDPLYSAVDMENYMADAAQQMMVLKSLRDEFGCSFLLAHHTTKTKQDGGRARDDLWGSQFLNAWLETGWQMRLGDEEGVVQVTRHFKVCKNPDVINLHFKIDDYNYEVEIHDATQPAQNTRSARPDPPQLEMTAADVMIKGDVLHNGDLTDLKKLGIKVNRGRCYAP